MSVPPLPQATGDGDDDDSLNDDDEEEGDDAAADLGPVLPGAEHEDPFAAFAFADEADEGPLLAAAVLEQRARQKPDPQPAATPACSPVSERLHGAWAALQRTVAQDGWNSAATVEATEALVSVLRTSGGGVGDGGVRTLAAGLPARPLPLPLAALAYDDFLLLKLGGAGVDTPETLSARGRAAWHAAVALLLGASDAGSRWLADNARENMTGITCAVLAHPDSAALRAAWQAFLTNHVDNAAAIVAMAATATGTSPAAALSLLGVPEPSPPAAAAAAAAAADKVAQAEEAESALTGVVWRLRWGVAGAWALQPRVLPVAEMLRYPKKARLARLRRCRLLQTGARLPGAALASVQAANREVAALLLGTDLSFLGVVLEHGLRQGTLDFAAAAQAYDPALSPAELFQAARNAWTCFAIQLLYTGGAHTNDGVVGYSLLYPYSDNLLDDPAVTAAAKRAFQHRFRRWLVGDYGVEPTAAGAPSLKPQSPAEQHVLAQVERIHRRFPLPAHRTSMVALQAILDAQTASLGQHQAAGAPMPERGFIEDVTIYKGGTSVLADAYVAPLEGITTTQQAFSFVFGVALQLVDDIQDVGRDMASREHTLFTLHVADGANGDDDISRLLQLLVKTLAPVYNPGHDERQAWLMQQVLYMTTSMVMKSVAKSKTLFSAAYLQALEEYATLPFSSLAKVNSMRHLLQLVQKNLV